tara:strand:- start:4419 stop:4970 length:552 start_codon:yes stop_codon:yes gene_type:complete
MSWKDILKIGDRWNRGGKHRSHDESNNVNYDEYGQRMDNWKHRDHQSPEGKTDPNSRYTTQPHKEEMDKVWDEVVNNLKQIYGDKIQMVSPKWNQSTNMWYKNLDILTQPNATPLYVKFTILTHDGPDKDGNAPTKETAWPSTIWLQTTSNAKKINEVLTNAITKLKGMNLKNSFGRNTRIDD